MSVPIDAVRACPQNLLIVEDECKIRMITRRIVMRLRIPCVREVSDGARALSVLKQMPIDFVITHWSMPSMSDLELLSLLHRDSKLQHIPVLFLTARADVRSVRQAIEAGASGYLVKPFTPASLENKLEEMLSTTCGTCRHVVHHLTCR